jgi:hypothetical protein
MLLGSIGPHGDKNLKSNRLAMAGREVLGLLRCVPKLTEAGQRWQ